MTDMVSGIVSREDPSRHRAGPAAWLVLSPLLAWLLLWVVLPTLILVFYSFLTGNGISEVSATYTLSNYRRALAPVYLDVFVRSIGYAGLTTVLCLLIGYPVAYH